MDMEEQIAWKIRDDCHKHIREGRAIAAVILPLVKRAQAEEWARGAARVVNANRAARLVMPTDNPYIEQEVSDD